MSRPIRIEYPGALYHVTSRGIDQQHIFLDDDDRKVFLNILAMVVDRFNWRIHSYVMMDDHYHLVAETPNANLSKGMRQLNGVYTQHFNRTHGNDGALFQGRFKAILFERENYLADLCRHVVLNPVRANRIRNLDKYRWSSFRATAGLVPAPDYIDVDRLLSTFGKRTDANQRKYRKFVKDGIGKASPLDGRSSQVLLGGARFLREMMPLLSGETMVRKEPRQASRRKRLASIFRTLETMPRINRNRLIQEAHVEHNYTLMEIGQHLGLHYTTVSKVINTKIA